MRLSLSGIARAFHSPNPVTVKELRGRMRGARAFVFVAVFLLVMGCFVSLLYGTIWQSMQMPGTGGTEVYLVGKVIFGTVVIVELFAVSLLAPALSAGAIASERQRQTFDLLRTTLLPARSIVLGKLASSLTFLLLLVLTGLPLVSLAFLLGGVTLLEVGIALVLLLTTALSSSALGLCFSSLFRTTLAATVVSYVVMVLAMVGLPTVIVMGSSFLSAFLAGVGPTPGTQPNQGLLNALFYGLGFVGSTNPIITAVLTEVLLVEGYTALVFQLNLGIGFNPWIVSPWLVYAVFHTLFSWLLIALSIRFVKRKR
jgi:ABC-2 type transport system permease protein